ncbi:MAG TPA: MFS transporter, partial [Blastocatellia bacterium]|nr:MFS transporter [Blastocatellia bacterium]
ITDLKECFVYAVNTASIRVLLSMVAVVSVFGLPYSVLMPVFAKQLGGGAGALGFMLGASGVGALAAALTLAGRRRVHGLGRVVGGSALVFGLSLVIFSLSHNLGLSIALAVPAGFSNMLQLSGTNTLLQTIVPDRLRGRVMSLYAMCLMGMLPFGSLLAGATADRIGAEATVVIGGSVCIVGALVFWSRLPGLRRSSSEPLVEFGLTLDRDQPEPRTGDLF